jgi:hypothetical protein
MEVELITQQVELITQKGMEREMFGGYNKDGGIVVHNPLDYLYWFIYIYFHGISKLGFNQPCLLFSIFSIV